MTSFLETDLNGIQSPIYLAEMTAQHQSMFFDTESIPVLGLLSIQAIYHATDHSHENHVLSF